MGVLTCFLPDELIAFLQKVASEAPAVPFYYYHIPPLTGVKSKYCLVSSSQAHRLIATWVIPVAGVISLPA